jgi:hypothetical protein
MNAAGRAPNVGYRTDWIGLRHDNPNCVSFFVDLAALFWIFLSESINTTSPSAADIQSQNKMAALIDLYTCPMHPNFRKDKPGTFPKCGMELETANPPVAGTRYTCPMHPQIVQDRSGSCPICGMTLEARTIVAHAERRELDDMTHRFWVSLFLSVPLF